MSSANCEDTDDELRENWAAQKNFARQAFFPVLICVLFIGTLKVTSMVRTAEFWDGIIEWAPLTGHIKQQKIPSILYVRDRFEEYLHLLWRGRDVESININIGFEDWEHLRKKREATKERAVDMSDERYRKVTIDWRGDTLKAKIRLKGLLPDHRSHESKWSFALKMRGDDFFWGMDAFAIHHPMTRMFQSECLYTATLHEVDVLATRCEFIDVSINGKAIGVMVLTEKMSTNLLEMQGRKEGNLFSVYEDEFAKRERASRFARTNIAASSDRASFVANVSLSNQKMIAPLRPSGMKRVVQDENLLSQYQAAASLWEGMLRGELSPHEIFDAELVGSALAVTFLWGNPAFHPFMYHNLKFYFNPITFKFEVLPTDMASLGPIGGGPPAPKNIRVHYQLLQLLTSDAEIYGQFLSALSAYQGKIEAFGSPFGGDFGDLDRQYRDALRGEFPLLPPLNTEHFKDRINKYIDQLSKGAYFNSNVGPNLVDEFTPPATYRLDDVVSARFEVGAESAALLVLNRYATSFNVAKLQINYESDARKWTSEKTVNALLPPTMHGISKLGGRIAGELLIQVPRAEGEGQIVGVTVFLTHENQEFEYRVPAFEYPVVTMQNPVSPSSLDDIGLQYPFLQIDRATSEISVPSGVWGIKSYLKLPEGYGLKVSAGTKLIFSEGSGLLIRGSLQAIGSGSEPIIFTADSENTYWRGITVMKSNFWTPGERSHISNAVISRTEHSQFESWAVTGGVTFYKSDVDIVSSKITDTEAEDALNIVHSDFTLDDVMISDTRSDAFDGDFSVGRIVDSTFARVGGDAIDFSGSEIEVEDSKFFTVADKAVSVGEQSSLVGRNLQIVDVGTGIVSKDGSETQVDGVTFDETQYYEVMAYTKKPQYGSATLVVDNALGDKQLRSVAQKKSMLSVNGEKIPTKKLNVDALYDGYMAK